MTIAHKIYTFENLCIEKSFLKNYNEKIKREEEL